VPPKRFRVAVQTDVIGQGEPQQAIVARMSAATCGTAPRMSLSVALLRDRRLIRATRAEEAVSVISMRPASRDERKLHADA
jgi:uncharacterized DUF497 family protein